MDAIVLSLGSNMGDRQQNLEKAHQLLEKQGVKIQRGSKVYETEPADFADQNDFLNQVIVVETEKTPHELLECCQKIESDMGRKQTFKNGPRLIDIDLLFYHDELISTENLMLPHPRIEERRFVLQPLSDILSDEDHPRMGTSIAELLDECEDELIVKPYS